MNVSISRLNSHLVVVANCFTPSTLEAVDPSASTVKFLKNVAGSFVVDTLGTVQLTQIASTTGVYGALVNIAGIDTSNLVAVVECTISGVVTKQVVVLGRSMNVGMPSIIVEDVEKKGNANFGISA